MSDPHTPARFASRLPLCAVAVLLACAPPARALQRDPDEVPTGARRAAEWHPTKEGIVGEPWQVSASAGIAYFTGDGDLDTSGFTAELRLSHDLSNDFYVVGSYFLAIAGTDVDNPIDGSSDSDTAVLHIPTIGVGYRLEMNPEIYLFFEPRIGILFSGDADTGPAGGISTGVEIDLDPSIAIRFAFTGLFTDTRLDTSSGDVDLNGIWSVNVGMAWRF